MKDNISLIFAAIIGVFLIVILPLFSILDRQDSMSYNVVLTETTNFIDKIRNNGFIDNDSYTRYISSLATTSNTYKVTLEAYKKKIVHDTDEEGNILEDRFKEEKELYNSIDIFDAITNGNKKENNNLNNSVFLFNEGDEVYIKVHNTNLTAGSVLYRFLSGVTNTNVINISYGGIINNVDWELYNQVASSKKDVPEVLMTVPVNGYGKTNIIKTANSTIDDIDYVEIYSEEDLTNEEENILNALEDNVYNLDETYISLTGNDYAYLYDLSKPENKTIKVSLELKNITKIEVKYSSKDKVVVENVSLDNLESYFNNKEYGDEVKQYILDKIELNGIFADKEISIRKNKEYYFFDITLKNVRLSYLDYISSIASITVLPGIGQDENGVLSLGTESVKIEIIDKDSVNRVLISGPYNFKKLIESNLSKSLIKNSEVFKDEEIMFVVSFTGINHDINEIINSIKAHLKIYDDISYKNLEIIDVEEFKETYGEKPISQILTGLTNHVIVKFSYSEKNAERLNYIELDEAWITTNIDGYEEGEFEDAAGSKYAHGAKSSTYSVLLDDEAPFEPAIILNGTLGENGWYTSDVEVSLDESKTDAIKFGNKYRKENNEDESEEGEKEEYYSIDELNTRVAGGSGVYRNYIEITGKNKLEKIIYLSPVLVGNDGESKVVAYADDYIGNEITTKPLTLKIDKTKPSKPEIKITSGTKGNNNWYKSDVEIEITPGKDETSGVSKTTYLINGVNEVTEREGTYHKLTNEGISTVIARTYDNAGNYSETELEVKIEKTEPAIPEIKIVSGEKYNEDWYYTNVSLKISVSKGESVSDVAYSKYRVKEKNSNADYIDFTETEKDVTISQSGEYTVTVITYTKAGNSRTSELNVKIDKEAPEVAKINLSGVEGENGWYTSSVNVVLKLNEDIGPSGATNYIRFVLNNGTETEVQDGYSMLLSEDGEYILDVYTTDNAGNRSKDTRVIKIDKMGPLGDFKITGTKGEDGWYTSDVNISYENVQDATSGINKAELSKTSITENTNSETVTFTIKDNAGNVTTKNIEIKIDKENPTMPVVELPEVSATGVASVNLYNADVVIKITSGEDFESGIDRTTYEVTKDGNVIINEMVSPSTYTINQNGYYIVTVRIYDKAGNYSEISKTIWLNKDKPDTPTITAINDESTEGVSTKTITGENNLKINIDNTEFENIIKLTLTNTDTYDVITQEFEQLENDEINYTLTNKGRYSIKINQTNMFGTTSESSSGTYYYIYE